MPYDKAMAGFPLKYAAGGLLVIVIAAGYRLMTKSPNEDNRNYEIIYAKPIGWTELPHNPNTLLLMRHPKTNALVRCAATQVVSASNPEPDMDTDNLVKRVVSNAKESQAAEWTTETLEDVDTGKMRFGIFRKTRKNKTIVGAISVRGNTTLLVSISNTGQGAKDLAAGKMDDFLAFLKTFDMRETHKWGVSEE